MPARMEGTRLASHVPVTRRVLERLDDVPDHIREPLFASGLPATFDRFEIRFSVRALKTARWEDEPFLILGKTESGAVGVHLKDGSVSWLQSEVSGPPELRSPAYRQFINSSIHAFVHCVDECSRLLQNSGPDGAGLRKAVGSVDPEALNHAREGVWRDVALDWDSGL